MQDLHSFYKQYIKVQAELVSFIFHCCFCVNRIRINKNELTKVTLNWHRLLIAPKWS